MLIDLLPTPLKQFEGIDLGCDFRCHLSSGTDAVKSLAVSQSGSLKVMIDEIKTTLAAHDVGEERARNWFRLPGRVISKQPLFGEACTLASAKDRISQFFEEA